MSTPTRKAKLTANTFTGLQEFSGTNHAGIKLISLTTAQRDALTPANGMLIYNSTLGQVQKYASGAWSSLPSTSLDLYAENPSAPVAPVASGDNAIALGDTATASGQDALAAGQTVTASGRSAVALGSGTSATIEGQLAFGVGQIAGSQIHQWSVYHLGVFTNDATQTEVKTLASSTGVVALPNNSAFTFEIRVSAVTVSAGEVDGWTFAGIARRGANAAATTLPYLQENHIGGTVWAVDVDADTTAGSLRVRVTGEAGKTIRWAATVKTTEVQFNP